MTGGGVNRAIVYCQVLVRRHRAADAAGPLWRACCFL